MKKRNIVKNPSKIKQADIVVGIPSLNEADNIFFVAEQIDKGLRKYYPKHKSVIINVDNDSSDGTRDVFLKTKTKAAKIYVSTPKGVRGKGNNFLNLFEWAKKLDAKAVMVVDADLESIKPEWVKSFLEPILSGEYEYVTPSYTRNEYDGTITNNLTYPIIRGLYGMDLRQPIGGDFAFAPRLMDIWTSETWHKTTRQYGVDIFMTMGAILGKAKICQVKLGEKIHKPSAPKLGPMFSQVIATLLKGVIASKDQWMEKGVSQKVPVLGDKKMGKPQPLSVDYKSMKVAALFEYKTNRDILKRALTPEVFKKVDEMFKKEGIDFGKTLWTKVIYDSIYAYDTTDLNSGLIEALKPLYFGRVISFIKFTLDLSYEESEAEIREQAQRFWDLRSYLLAKYKDNKKKC